MARYRFWTPDLPTTTPQVFRGVVLPLQSDILSLVTGALLELTYPANWEVQGNMTEDDAADYFRALLHDFLEGQSHMLGAIIPFAVTTVPDCYLPCDGSQYLRENYPALYAILPPELIIDADNFITPDLRDLTLRGAGGAMDPMESGGSDTLTLSVDQLPAHDHTTVAHSHTDLGHVHATNLFLPSVTLEGVGVPIPTTETLPGGTTGPGSANIQASGVTINATGSGASIDATNAYLALSFYIMAK